MGERWELQGVGRGRREREAKQTKEKNRKMESGKGRLKRKHTNKIYTGGIQKDGWESESETLKWQRLLFPPRQTRRNIKANKWSQAVHQQPIAGEVIMGRQLGKGRQTSCVQLPGLWPRDLAPARSSLSSSVRAHIPSPWYTRHIERARDSHPGKWNTKKQREQTSSML